MKRSKKKASKIPEFDFPFLFSFASMTDGIKIALALGFPEEFNTKGSTKEWPTVLHSDGYSGAVFPVDPKVFDNNYVTISASIRGTGASGGIFQPFSRRTAQDGYEIIEDWIVKQPWSNGGVGIVGGSWSGLTGFLYATSRPPSLKAVSVAAVVDDFYRGILRMGGVRNSGFPNSWWNNIYLENGVYESDAVAVEARKITPTAFQKVLKTRKPYNMSEDFLWYSLNHPEDDSVWHENALSTHASQINAPIQICHAYQDEQTGPRGWRLWKHVPESVPKRLILSNGRHGMMGHFWEENKSWLDYWMLDKKKTGMADSTKRVQVYFETTKNILDNTSKNNPPETTGDFPFPQTIWMKYYLRGGKQLSLKPPTDLESSGSRSQRSYRIAVGVADEDIDHLEYSFNFRKPTAICGPITLTLWAKTTTIDTDFFVVIGDLDPDGNLHYLQRGMLRASHRLVDKIKSDFATYRGKKILICPHHPHCDPLPLTPHKLYKFLIEIHTVGHVFRKGHQLVIQISQPPLNDPVTCLEDGQFTYTYASAQPPGTVTVLHDKEHPSNILLPFLPSLPPVPEESPVLGTLAGIHYIKKED